MKDTFIWHKKWTDALSDFDKDVRLEVREAVEDYAFTGNIQSLKSNSKMAFNFMRQDIDRDTDRYMSIVKRNQQNGANGGRPKKQEDKPKKPSGFFGNPDKPKKPHIDYDYDYDKNNNTPPTPPKGGDGFDFSFVEENFKDAFMEWIEYKKQRRESYVSQKSLKMCYNKLLKLSHSNSKNAKEIVEQSMANNWAGLFELQNKQNGKAGSPLHTGILIADLNKW